MTKRDTTSMSERRRAFAREYLVDLNGTAAAIRAGYPARSARQRAHELMLDSAVRELVERGLAERSRRTGVTQDRVIRELARIAFADQRQVVAWGPGGVQIIDSSALDDDAAAAVAEVAETKDGLRVKAHDKVRALELLGRHVGLWRDGDAPSSARVVVVVHPHGSTVVQGEALDVGNEAS